MKVGHSIGAYIGLEVFKRLQNKVSNINSCPCLALLPTTRPYTLLTFVFTSLEQIKMFVGLYPFLKLNKNSVTQSAIGYIARY